MSVSYSELVTGVIRHAKALAFAEKCDVLRSYHILVALHYYRVDPQVIGAFREALGVPADVLRWPRSVIKGSETLRMASVCGETQPGKIDGRTLPLSSPLDPIFQALDACANSDRQVATLTKMLMGLDDKHIERFKQANVTPGGRPAPHDCAGWQSVAAEVQSSIKGQDHVVDRLCMEMGAFFDDPSRTAGLGSVLIAGPSGCGKTAMVKRIHRVSGVPWISVKAKEIGPYKEQIDKYALYARIYEALTGETPSGEKFKPGKEHIERIVEEGRRLIVFIDEVDKVFLGAYETRDNTGWITHSTHELMEILGRGDADEYLEEMLSRVFIICAGAFQKAVVRKLQDLRKAGGGVDDVKLSADDLTNSGVPTELAGRFTTVLCIRPLTALTPRMRSAQHWDRRAIDVIKSVARDSLGGGGRNILPEDVLETLAGSVFSKGQGLRDFNRYLGRLRALEFRGSASPEGVRSLVEELIAENRASMESGINESRTVDVVGEVNPESLERWRNQILQLELQSMFEPITLDIDSPGGVLYTLDALFDTLDSIECTVHTRVVGRAASAAALLAVLGHRNGGRRYAYVNATLLFHSVRLGAANDLTVSRAKTIITDLEKADHRLFGELRALTGRSSKCASEIDEFFKRCAEGDAVLTGEEAICFGFIDEISRYD